MRFPSIQSVLTGFLKVVHRFPLESLSALLSTVSLIIVIEREVYPPREIDNNLLRLALCGWLGLNLFLAATLFVERKLWSPPKAWSIKGLILAFLAACFFLIDPHLEVDMIRFSFLIVGAHLLVSFVAFTLNDDVESFWEFNKILFIRILTAGLYSTALYAGISIAMASSDVLFDLSIDEKSYGQLGLSIYGIFNTLFFLAGVPDGSSTFKQPEYPKGLRVFTQFVLIPLAIIYLAILLAYELKLIVQWSLPKGLVGSLVLGYAVFGILAILLVHPIRNSSEHVWIKTFTRWFYLLLIPLIVLLVIAIWIRVDAYGITESRYVVILLSLWLTGITVYFILSKNKNIKVIPITLCIFSFVSTWGPQSASSISKLSQVARLVAYFDDHNAIENGKLVPLAEASDEVRDVGQFLMRRYGPHVMQPLLSINIDSIYQAADTVKDQRVSEYQIREQVLDYLGLQASYYPRGEYFSVHSEMPIDVRGFSQMIAFSKNDMDKSPSMSSAEHFSEYNHDIKIFIDSVSVRINYDTAVVKLNLDSAFNHALRMLDSRATTRVTMPVHLLSADSEDHSIRLVVEYMSCFRIKGDATTLQSCNGYLLIK